MSAHAPQLRLGDADRQAALEALGEHFAQGRLTREELDERSDAVWSAKTYGDLGGLFADLPAEPAGRSEQSREQRRGAGRRPFAGPSVRPFLLPVLVVLIALTVLTHLPLVLVAVAVWVVLGRRRWHHPRG